MTALSRRLNQAKPDVNVDARVNEANKAGYGIDRATVFKALNGEHAKSPRDATLRALAYVFQIDVRELRRLVDRPAGEVDPWVPPEEAAQLNDEQRRALDQLIKAIVRAPAAAVEVEDGDEVEEVEPTVREVLAAREKESHLRAVAHEGDDDDAERVDEIARQIRERQAMD